MFPNATGTIPPGTGRSGLLLSVRPPISSMHCEAPERARSTGRIRQVGRRSSSVCTTRSPRGPRITSRPWRSSTVPGGCARRRRSRAAKTYLNVKGLLPNVSFETSQGQVTVGRRPAGVAALITLWNSDLLMMSQKVAPALAAGCTMVIKPSELSALQTQVFHPASAASSASRASRNTWRRRRSLRPDHGRTALSGQSREPDGVPVSGRPQQLVGFETSLAQRGAHLSAEQVMLTACIAEQRRQDRPL